MKFSCTLCGSRDWPTAETDCPLCYRPETEEPTETDNETDEDELS